MAIVLVNLMKTVVTFGEMLLRLEPPAHERLRHARALAMIFGGAEANVAVSLVTFGMATQYITALPPHEMGDAALAYLRQFGVGTDHILRVGERLGLYFSEKGSAQRASKVIYDRTGSSFTTLAQGQVEWDVIFADADWFHWTGITPALTATTAAVCMEALEAARAQGIPISCDLNYRHALWKWGKNPTEVMPALVALSDIVVGNTETIETFFGIPRPTVESTDSAIEIARRLVAQFPTVQTVALTLRATHSASHNSWSAVLLHQGNAYTATDYDLSPIVERVGGGDAFTAGLIYGLRHRPNDPTYALQFATAAGCLKHTIPGDANLITPTEVEALMAGDGSGRIRR